VYLELGGDGVLVHVDVVLVDGVHDELVALGLHPGGDEGRQVQPRVPVQHQLVVDDLVRRLLGDRVLGHPVPARVNHNPSIQSSLAIREHGLEAPTRHCSDPRLGSQHKYQLEQRPE
jgi:hypothetical protein